ncbi:MAG TPA: hypothetical protein VME23_08905 [Terracidiphilus sp.]|nr:hypothetical protein [Terracidiphilus sp.]
MTRPSFRFLLIACCVIVQIHPPSFAKESRKDKDISGVTYALFRDGSTSGKDMLLTIVEQTHWDNGGAGNLDRLAYHLRFVKVGETQTPEGSVTRYRIFAEGAPENKVYGLGTWIVGKLVSYGDQDVYVNAQGLVMTRRAHLAEEGASELPGVELLVSPKNIPGEPTRYALYSRDREVTAFGTLVPHPVVNQDGGCRLEARIAAPDATAVLIVADGFAARARLPVVLESQGEITNVDVVTDDNGHAVVASFPYIQGKIQGTLKASAEGQDCLPSVQVPWGGGTASAQVKK